MISPPNRLYRSIRLDFSVFDIKLGFRKYLSLLYVLTRLNKDADYEFANLTTLLGDNDYATSRSIPNCRIY